MTDSYAAVLTRCIIVSCIGLLSMSAFPIHPAIPFLFGLAPLLWYHLRYLTPRARLSGLSQAAIDSVYYYGFLVTIAALGASSLQLALRGIGNDFTTVAFQFGFGLLATGYAVWARIHLTAASRLAEEGSPEEVMDRYIQRSRELVANVELATSSFRSFSETLTQESASFSNQAQLETHTAIKAAAAAFRVETAALAKEAGQSLIDLRAVINDVTFAAEREEMRKSVRSVIGSVSSLNKGMETLTASTASGATSVGQLASSFAGVRDNAVDLASQLTKLSAQDGAVARLAASVEAGAVAFDHAGESVRRSWTSVEDVVGQLEGAAAAMSGMEALASEAKSRLGALAGALKDVELLSTETSGAAAGLRAMAEQGEASGAAALPFREALAAVQAKLEALNASLASSAGGLQQSMAAASAHLDETLTASTQSVQLLSARLGSVADFIIDRTNAQARTVDAAQ